ncbi:MAG: hypothetical protein LAT68_00255 [Cyclobacteriaceae bacterium]|nr:hypothetical protein [Cyclobacteriaceae bacterium]MCH8514733.1 hypothetical protein [Cyclobacteriaceae bacterium]
MKSEPFENKIFNHVTTVIPNDQLRPEHLPATFADWNTIVSFGLSFHNSAYLSEIEKLREFAMNGLESYKEYGFTKKYSLDELRAILYFFAKKSASDNQSPVGTELKFIIQLIDKMHNLLEEKQDD